MIVKSAPVAIAKYTKRYKKQAVFTETVILTSMALSSTHWLM